MNEEPIDLAQARKRGTGAHTPKSSHAYRSDVTYPDRIIGAREVAELSLAALAALTGIAESDLVLLESGMLQPDREQLEQIGRATGFPVAWFSQPPDPAWPGIEHTSLRFH